MMMLGDATRRDTKGARVNSEFRFATARFLTWQLLDITRLTG